MKYTDSVASMRRVERGGVGFTLDIYRLESLQQLVGTCTPVTVIPPKPLINQSIFFLKPSKVSRNQFWVKWVGCRGAMDGRDGDMDGSVDSLEPYFAGFEAGVLRLGSFLLNITPRQKVAAVSGGVSVELCRVCHHLASLIGSRNDAQILASLRCRVRHHSVYSKPTLLSAFLPVV